MIRVEVRRGDEPVALLWLPGVPRPGDELRLDNEVGSGPPIYLEVRHVIWRDEEAPWVVVL